MYVLIRHNEGLTDASVESRTISWSSASTVLLMCRKMAVKSKDAATVTKFSAKLVEHAAKIGGVFVHYDPESATWIMKVNHFSK